MATKIASLVSLFREAFPDATADLRPWMMDETTQRLLDPHSIDVSFLFPGWHPTCRGHCVLLQVRFCEAMQQAIGIEAMGYSFETLQWRSSTIGDWRFEGIDPPTLEAQRKLRSFFRQVFALFQHPMCCDRKVG